MLRIQLASAAWMKPQPRASQCFVGSPRRKLQNRVRQQADEVWACLESLPYAELEILREAKDSRNYIAHQGADFESIVDISDEMLDEYIARLRFQVERLAEGDNVVLKWCYQFIEREAAPTVIQEKYSSIVLAWVFPQRTTVSFING